MKCARYTHCALIRNLIKLKGRAKLTAQGEWLCLKDTKCIRVTFSHKVNFKSEKSKPALAFSNSFGK